MNKKYAALFTASVLLLTSLSAAENFPTSQFDYDGWYRPNGTFCPAQDAVATPRPTATPASAPVKTSAPSTGDDYTTPSSQVQGNFRVPMIFILCEGGNNSAKKRSDFQERCLAGSAL